MCILKSLNGQIQYDQQREKIVLTGGTVLSDSSLRRNLRPPWDSQPPKPSLDQHTSCSHLRVAHGKSNLVEDPGPPAMLEISAPLCPASPKFDDHEVDANRETPRHNMDNQSNDTRNQAQLTTNTLLDSTVTHITGQLAFYFTLLAILLPSWNSFINSNLCRWPAYFSRIAATPSGLDLPTVETLHNASNTIKRVLTRYYDLARLLLNCSDLDHLRIISFSCPCWRIDDPSPELSNYTRPPEDGESPDGYNAQSSSSQWTDPRGLPDRAETGVWSHGSFNTGDPSALLLWEKHRLQRLLQLEHEARILGYTLVPLPQSLPQTGSQPTYQISLPPTPPVPLIYQPGPSSAVPERDSWLNPVGRSATYRTTNGSHTRVPDSLQSNTLTQSCSPRLHAGSYSAPQPNPTSDIRSDSQLGPLSPSLLEGIENLFSDINTSQRREALESNMDQLGQFENYMPEGLGGFSDTPDIFNPPFTAQTSSTNSYAYISGTSNRCSTSASAPPIISVENPATAALSQHNPAYDNYSHHATTRSTQSDQAHADQAQPGSNTDHILHPRYQESFAGTSSRCITNTVLRQSQTHSAGSPTSYQFFHSTPDTYQRGRRRAGS